MDWAEMLADLRAGLPVAQIGNSAVCGISVLRLPIEASASPLTRERAPGQCANCGIQPHGPKSPFCGESCRAAASLARQFRGSLASRTLLDPERQLGLAQSLWHLLGGGYPHRLTLIPPSAVERTLKQRGYACATCGGHATTFDHVKTACNRPINLRAVCAACQQTRPFHHADILALGAETLANLAARIQNPAPQLACDDPEAWDWRAYIAGAR